MENIQFFDKEEQKLAESLENEEWISDFSTNDKKRYEEYAQFILLMVINLTF
jgi:hypothetical protein